MSIRGETRKKLCASHNVSEADSTHFSEKSCFRLRQQIHWPIFVSSFSDVYRVIIPGGFPHRSILLFQAL